MGISCRVFNDIYIRIRKTERLYSELFSLIGMVMILASMVVIHISAFPGYVVLLPVGGAVLLLKFVPESYITNNILKFPALTFIGRISYSLYLWHWPIKVCSNYFIVNTSHTVTTILLITFSVLLSVLSWRYIEQPFRRKGKIVANYKPVFRFAGYSTLLLAVVLSLISLKKGFPGNSAEDRLLREVKTDSQWSKTWRYYRQTLKLDFTHSLPFIGDTSLSPEFLLWGDSHAGVLIPAFESAVAEIGKAGFAAIIFGDPPIIPSANRKNNNPNLLSLNLEILRVISKNPTIKKVFLDARWASYGNFSVNEEPPHKTTNLDSINLRPKRQFDREFLLLTDTLVKMGKKIVIIAPLPELNAPPRKYILLSKFMKKSINNLTPTREDFFQKNAQVFEFFKKMSIRPNVRVLFIHERFLKNDNTLLLDNGHLLFLDPHHLTKWGAMKIKDLVTSMLK